MPLKLDQGYPSKVVCLLVTARDLPDRICTTWVMSQLAGLVSKNPASICLFGDRDNRYSPLLGTRQQTCPPRCICSGPALHLQHQLTVCGSTLNSVQDKPSLLSHSCPALPVPLPVPPCKVQKLCRHTDMRCAVPSGLMLPCHLHSSRLILCLSQERKNV